MSDYNTLMVALSAAGQFTLASSLHFACWRNHLKHVARPIVKVLAAYFTGAFMMTLMRVVVRVYVENGGLSSLLVNGWAFTVLATLHALLTWSVYVVLVKKYPEAKEECPE